MDAFLQDLHFAARSLWRARTLTLTAVICLAVGIGANTGVFSVVNGILLRPLPFAAADRLMAVQASHDARGVTDGGVTDGDMVDLRESGVFEQLEAQSGRNFTLTAGDQPERIEGSVVTPGLFGMLGVEPRIGRGFLPEDAGPAGFEKAVLLSDALWQRSFGADEGIVGRGVHINGRTITVIGVMPPGFRFPETDELWLAVAPADASDRTARYLLAVGRLRTDMSLTVARQRLADAAVRVAAAHPQSNEGWRYTIKPFREAFVDAPAQRLLVVMLGAVSFVLLIACANVANLLLARATDRRNEVSVRAALGASRARMVRLFLTESVLLAVAGGIAGVLLSVWWVDATKRLIPEEMPHWISMDIDGTVLLYTLLLSLGTGLLFGTIPALNATRPDLHNDLKDSSRSSGESRGRARMRSVLVTGEIALSVVLLVGAAFMMQSFLRLQTADAGFDERTLTSLRITAAGDHYDQQQARIAFYGSAARRLTELPNVAAVAVTSSIPADDGGPTVTLRADGVSAEPLIATTYSSTESLFDALGVPLLAGRSFTATEAADSAARVAIVGRALAARLWPGGDAVGRRITLGERAPYESYVIVGIAPDLQYEEFGEAGDRARLQVHLPYARRPYRQMALLVRARGTDPATLKQPVREALRSIDASLAPYDELTMQERRRYTTWPQRLFGQTFGTFGGVALLLALVGVYGVMAYTVAQRRREIGIRMAIGASPRDVLREIVGRAARIGSIGAALGTVGAFGTVRLLEGLVYGVSLTDPITFLVVPALLLGTALLAGYIPARRASRIDPVSALRI